MTRIYFDFTDVISFAENNDRVTGIQRVQLSLLSRMVQSHGCESVMGVAYFGRHGGWQVFRLDWLRFDGEFNATDFLVSIGKIRPSIFPPVAQIKRSVSVYNHRKWLRAVMKVGLYVRSIVARRSMRNQGFSFYSEGDCPDVSNQKVNELPADAVYVLLGIDSGNERVQDFAKRHHDVGGVVAQMVHDLIPYAYPAFHDAKLANNFNAWLIRTISYVDMYMCVSKNTAHELKRFLAEKGAELDVVVTPLAHEFLGFERGRVAPMPSLPHGNLTQLEHQEYVLCVGSIEARKNGLNLLKAWAQVQALLKERTPKLVFAGRLAWKVEDFKKYLLESNGVCNTVTIVEHPSDADLAWLYSHCKFTVYPSQYEGWGLPVGESAWFSKFCVASHASSIPEVCGDLMDYLCPDDVEDIARQILHALVDDSYVAARNLAISTALLRSWRDVANDVFHHLQRLGVPRIKAK